MYSILNRAREIIENKFGSNKENPKPKYVIKIRRNKWGFPVVRREIDRSDNSRRS